VLVVWLAVVVVADDEPLSEGVLDHWDGHSAVLAQFCHTHSVITLLLRSSTDLVRRYAGRTGCRLFRHALGGGAGADGNFVAIGQTDELPPSGR
jgi:hypothetical protein